MQTTWPLWKRLLFRFFFIYLALAIEPWAWLDNVPGVSVVTQFFTKHYYSAVDWAVAKSNAWIFHVRPQLVPFNGSGDTSYGWALLWFSISFSAMGMLIWSFLQPRKKDYTRLNYWLCVFTRYHVSLVLFSYGIIKLFSLQMPFPNYSQLATPLGDFLPMRLSWMFIGYSAPYQAFSGLMETVAAILLVYRPTVTLGLLIATGVFLNIAALNLSYDIPVKIFSIEMIVYCLFLLANESERLFCFFVQNRTAAPCTVYQHSFPKKWMRVSRVALKLIFVVIAAGTVLWTSFDWKRENLAEMSNMPFEAGMYDVNDFVLNRDTIRLSDGDSVRWTNLVFDNNHSGSIATADTAFYGRYHRGYFQYKFDTSQQSLNIFKTIADSKPILSLRYKVGDDNSLYFWGARQKDSVWFRLRKNPHHFQLAERQFHWLSEANR